MEKLTKKQIEKFSFSKKVRKEPSIITKKFLKLGIGEGYYITEKEWFNKKRDILTTPAKLIHCSMLLKYQFKVITIKNPRAWVIQRIKINNII